MAERHSAMTTVIMIIFFPTLYRVLLLLYFIPLSWLCFKLTPLSLIFMKINLLSAYSPLLNHNNTLSDGNKKEEKTTIYHTLYAITFKEAKLQHPWQCYQYKLKHMHIVYSKPYRVYIRVIFAGVIHHLEIRNNHFSKEDSLLLKEIIQLLKATAN